MLRLLIYVEDIYVDAGYVEDDGYTGYRQPWRAPRLIFRRRC